MNEVNGTISCFRMGNTSIDGRSFQNFLIKINSQENRFLMLANLPVLMWVSFLKKYFKLYEKYYVIILPGVYM